MFGSTVGFSGSADRIALFTVWPNSLGVWENSARAVIILVKEYVFLVGRLLNFTEFQ